MEKAINELKRHIREVTAEMDDEKYIDFMERIGTWALNEAEKADYRPDMETDNYNNLNTPKQ